MLAVIEGVRLNAWVIGVATTPFRRWPDRSHADLAAAAVAGAIGDAGLDGLPGLAGIWFANCGLHAWGQANVRGQVVLDPLVREATIPAHTPIVNVEAGCATGSLAFHGALRELQAGAELALAVGVEKTFIPHDPAAMMALFDGALDTSDPAAVRAYYAAAAAQIGDTFAPEPGRIMLLDVCALEARDHMRRYGTTVRQLAAVAAKNHAHGAMNPDAQYRTPMTTDEVLADKPILAPLTRAMCAPISDGAAAVLVASDAFVARHGLAARAVRIRACALAGGAWRALDQPSVARIAGDRAYEAAGLGPDDVDVAEVHDATAFAELYATEMLRFCAEGDGGPYAESGETALGARRPVNPSGGLESKGHPLGATGLAMITELVRQLRGEAGVRQTDRARIALAHNGGGLIGFDEAACAVTILGN